MRAVRTIHSLSAFLFTAGFAARMYYGVLRREWRMIIPEPRDILASPGFLKYLLYLSPREPHFRKYNPGQKFLYSFWTLLAMVMLPLGYCLYAPKLFARPVKWLGGLNRVRSLLYHLSLLTAATIAGHIYLALTSSIGKLKSMFTGYYTRGS
jgi:Ni/Fe-hydrogenase 1 B-type cytochrome subunit